MENKFVQYITNAGVTVGIIPEIGGSIVSVTKDDSPNLIKSNAALWDFSQKPVVDENTDFMPYNGHTVWLGPQNEWWIHQSVHQQRKQTAAEWPPDPYLYMAEYKVVNKTDSTIHIVGPHSPISGVTIEKEIAVNPDGSIFVQATVWNTSDAPCAWDVWHNTRFDGKCKMSVLASPENIRVVPVLNAQSAEMPYEIAEGRFSYCPQKPPHDFSERSSKAFIYPSTPEISIETDNYVMQILFELHAKNEIHPSQGLVEIYNHTEHGDDNDLLEVEYHSPYRQLDIDERITSYEVWKITQKN